jgi:hypothetical protein
MERLSPEKIAEIRNHPPGPHNVIARELGVSPHSVQKYRCEISTHRPVIPPPEVSRGWEYVRKLNREQVEQIRRDAARGIYSP